MPQDLQVLLLEDIANLGRVGDVVNVSESYARNALFPQGKAALATKQVQKETEEKSMAKQKQAEEQLRGYQEIAEKMEATELVISAKAKDGDEIFGSITVKQVSDLLNKESQLHVSTKQIQGDFPIKKAGMHDITIQLGQGVEFSMKLNVEAAKEDNEKGDE